MIEEQTEEERRAAQEALRQHHIRRIKHWEENVMCQTCRAPWTRYKRDEEVDHRVCADCGCCACDGRQVLHR